MLITHPMNTSKTFLTALAGLLGSALSLTADVSLPHIFGDHMVLQRHQANPVWGHADPGEKITVTINGQSHSTVATPDGNWRVKLSSLPAGGPHELIIAGQNTVTFTDVLVGEVWICSGQSNMVRPLSSADNADVEIVTANYPEIRLISVPNVASQAPLGDFAGKWETCSPQTVADFSAIGYLFGRRIHNAVGVPIGLIDNAWGGSAADAWVPRDVLEAEGDYRELLESWDKTTAAYPDEVHNAALEKFEAWQVAGKPGRTQRAPRDPRQSQQRPANLFNGVLHPTIGYGIRGVIWYQGEANAKRAYQYRDLFPLMISTWRDLWGQGDFPFYWVQLADFRAELAEPADSDWAELREAQTMTLSLPHSGQAVITDAGEGRDIHPHDKVTVANRLARLALGNDYGFDLATESPRYTGMKTAGDTITLTFDHVSQDGLYSFDVTDPIGFAIAGADKKFVWAEAKIIGKNQVQVSSPTVPNPVAVRYAWADYPVANLQDRNGLPVTPFRTDDWPAVTRGVVK